MELLVLGPLLVTVAGRPVDLGGPREQAVLAVLATRGGQVVTSESLIDAIWDDDPPKTATKTLQTYVFRIRRALGEAGSFLTTDSGGYALRVEPDAVDAVRFERLAAAGRAARASGDHSRAVEMLDAALMLWRGAPFSGVAASLALEAERTRLSELRLETIEERVEAQLETGCVSDVIGQLERIIAEHPLRERLWAALMVALYRSGRQADALRAYQRARRELIGAIGVEPGPILQAIESRVLAQDPTLFMPQTDRGGSTLVPLPRALEQAAAAAFVDREGELARLRSAWDAARSQSQLRAVVISGDAGVGKTRLAAELATEAHEEGAVVLYGACDDSAIVPFQPFLEAIRHLVRWASMDDLASLGTATLAPLARLLPELAQRAPIEAGHAANDPHQARHELFEAVVAFFSSWSRRRPLLLVVDDVHWADDATLLLLRTIVRSLDSGALMIIATSREEEPAAGSRGQVTLTRLPAIERLELHGLTRGGVEALVAAAPHVPEVARQSLAWAVELATGGNPFFVEQVIGQLADLGAHQLRIEASDIPSGIREVIGSRVARLTPLARRALGVGAVCGMTFHASVVAKAGDAPLDGTIDALDEAVAARLLTTTRGAADEYRFRHGLVQAAVRDLLTPARRAHLHRRVAAVLEALEQRDPGAHLAQLAYHFAEGYQPARADKGVEYAQRAGDQALALLAFEDAATQYERGLARIASARDGERRAECALLRALAEARRCAGQVDAATTAWREAATCARDVGDPVALALAALGMARHRRSMAHRHGEEEQLLEEVLTALPPDEAETRVRVQVALARWRGARGDVEANLALAEEALNRARQIGDRGLIAAAIEGWLSVLGPLRAQQRIELADELLAEARGLGDARLEAEALRSLSWARLELCDVDGWASALRDLEEAAARAREPLWRFTITNARLVQLMCEGRLAECEGHLTRWLSEAEASVPQADAVLLLAVTTTYLSWLTGAEPAAPDRAAPSAGIDDNRMVDAIGLLVRAQLGDPLLIDALDSWTTVVATAPDSGVLPVFIAAVATAAAAAGHVEAATAVTSRLAPLSDRALVFPVAGFLGHARHHLGEMAMVLGDVSDALAHLRAAAEAHRRMGWRPWIALTEEALARAELLFGDACAAESHAREGLALAEAMGMKPLAAKAHEVLACLSDP